MKKKRIVAKLDIKTDKLIKGVQFECLRVLGDPREKANQYFHDGADELIYIDTVASLYNRNSLTDLISYTCEEINIPLTVGGGMRNLNDIEKLFKSGADKVAINSFAVKHPHFIKEVVKNFGSQSIVSSIQAKKINNDWEVYTDNGREPSNIKINDWISTVQECGVGEILITSVDRDGTKNGYDKELLQHIQNAIKVPLMFCGGARDTNDINDLLKYDCIDAAVLASILHYDESNIKLIKESAFKFGINLRKLENSNIEIKKNTKLNLEKNYNFYSLNNLENIKKNKIKKLSSVNTLKFSKNEIAIIDIGISNVKSVYNSVKKIDKNIIVTNKPDEILESKKIILPGVGSFKQASMNLAKFNISKSILSKVSSGTPILGICLGMQLMLTKGIEGGESPGLDIFKGIVKKIPSKKIHIGWNNVIFKKDKFVDLFKKDDLDFYFVHSYHCELENKKYEVGTSSYEDFNFCSVIEKENIMATQFHLEKSGNHGLDLLNYFLKK